MARWPKEYPNSVRRQIMDHLRKSPEEWMSGRAIAIAIGRNSGTVFSTLNSLWYWDEVECMYERCERKGRMQFYRKKQPTTWMQAVEAIL